MSIDNPGRGSADRPNERGEQPEHRRVRREDITDEELDRQAAEWAKYARRLPSLEERRAKRAAEGREPTEAQRAEMEAEWGRPYEELQQIGQPNQHEQREQHQQPDQPGQSGQRETTDASNANSSSSDTTGEQDTSNDDDTESDHRPDSPSPDNPPEQPTDRNTEPDNQDQQPNTDQHGNGDNNDNRGPPGDAPTINDGNDDPEDNDNDRSNAAQAMPLDTTGEPAVDSPEYAEWYRDQLDTADAPAPRSQNPEITELPPYEKKPGGTVGRLTDVDGNLLAEFTSGYGEPGNAVDVPVKHRSLRAHVEAHSAAWMRQNDVDESVLYLNLPMCPFNRPEGHPERSPDWEGTCSVQLPRWIPDNGKITVYDPEGWHVRRAGDSDND